MGIDFGIYNAGTEEFVIEGQFCDLGGFFNLCQMLGYAGEMLRAVVSSEECLEENPEMAQAGREAFDWFDQYGEECQEDALAAFENYTVFCRETAANALKESEVEGSHEGLEALSELTAEAFDPQIRALFGRLIFMQEDVTPEAGGGFAFWVHILLGVMKGFSQQFKESKEEEEQMVALAMDSAVGCLEPLIEFAEKCAEEEVVFQFDF
jgi:hypothetical protein